MYVQIFIPDVVAAFQKMEHAINQHCNESAPSNSSAPMRPGDFCVARSSVDGVWYRARVAETVENGAAFKVMFIDYGNKEVVKVSDVRPFLEQFSKVPAMAVHCTLARVCPPGGGKTWNKEASEYVSKLVSSSFVIDPTLYYC